MRNKKRTKKGINLMWLSFVLILLSGCSIITDPKLLMREPSLSSDKSTLLSVINNEIRSEMKGATIVRPRNSNDVSSIRVADLNQDGVKEAIVFYETPEEVVRLHGLILSNVNDQWKVQTKFDIEGQILESFELRDMTGNGHINIIVGYSGENNEAQKGLTVYSYTGSKVETLVSLPYNYYMIDDLNHDGKADLTIVTLRKQQYAIITTYQYNNNLFQELDHIQLDDHIQEYYNIVHGNVTPKTRGIILDAALGAKDAYSHIIIMRDGKLVDLVNQDYTYKAVPILSGDVNDDGILEIGRPERPKGWEYISYDEIPWLYSYYQWDDEKGLKFVMQQYMDSAGRFYFNFPTEWYGNVTIDTKNSDKNRYIRFIRIDNSETLAEIRFFSRSEWEQNKDEWELLDSDKDKMIGFRSHTDLKFDKSEKEIKR
ncbi:hypothetical protein J2Z32_000521 [Paenibacillus turicensis]|uniref:VCBS repeat-containing protein n=1 Tax=Paenibacillus turicensis TaxID=160487 RepID=A0ABS4FMU7_9BACL|nr:hypothetical protein [Paenibacillus turicensis]MBP1903904.1 hypothetical protein [Paenibacillus turicensis]